MVPSFKGRCNLVRRGLRFWILILVLLSCKDEDELLLSVFPEMDFPKVFFSFPGRYIPAGEKRIVRDEIINLIADAKQEIYMHIYSFQDPEIEEALLSARKRGVDLNLLGEWGKEYPSSLVPYFRYWKGSGLQHTKVLVVDRKRVFLGTGNFTDYGLERDLNGYLEFPLSESEMDSFFSFLEETYAFPVLAIGGFEFRNSPEEGNLIQNRFLDSIQSSENSVEYLIFDHYDAVMSIQFANSLADTIRGIYDRPADPEGKTLSGLSKVLVFEDGNEDRLDDPLPGKGGLLHHKSMIIDGNEVLTGSFNFSLSARDSNREISVRSKHSKLVEAFAEEWGRIHKDSAQIFHPLEIKPSSFWLESETNRICRSGTESQEVLMDIGKDWFRWRNLYRFSEGESCKSINGYESISSRSFGGKSEFPDASWELGLKALGRNGTLPFEIQPSPIAMDLYQAMRKPVRFIRPSHVLLSDRAWIFPDALPGRDLPSRPANAVWVFGRGKLPRKLTVSLAAGVNFLNESWERGAGVVFAEYEKDLIAFCYREFGYSPSWPEEMLFAIWEKNFEKYHRFPDQEDNDFFGRPGLAHKRRENLCGTAF